MAQVQSNDISLKSSRETAPGTASTTWLDQFFNPGTLKASPSIRKVVSNPVSKNGNPQKGATVGVDSSLSYECDATFEPAYEYGEAAFLSTYRGGTRFRPTAVTATGYTVASGGALAQNTLISVRGCPTAANNGLKVVGAGSIGTEIKTGGLAAEALTDPLNVTIDVVGFQGTAGDITINAGGNLTSTTLNFTNLGWSAGERIKIGGATAGTQFATAADNGTARIVTVAANLVTLDRRSATFVADTGAGKTIQLISGVTARTRLSVDDAKYLKRSHTFEVAYENLQNPDGTGDSYRYHVGHYLNELKINLATEAKASMNLSFVGLDSQTFTTSRLTGASTSRAVVSKKLFNCSSDIAVLLLAETDETVRSTYFETLSLTISNNITPKHVIGSEGAVLVNIGKVMVSIEAKLMFTHAEIPSAIRDNRTLAAWFGITNDDGAIFVDIPEMTLEGGDEDMPENETVSISVKCNAHQNDTLGYSAAMTLFPYYP